MLSINKEVWLELISEEHAQPIFDLVNANRDHLRPWLPWVDKMLTLENFRRYTSDSKRRNEENSEAGFVIIDKGKIVGRIGLYNIDHQNKIASIGYWIGKNDEGRGIILSSCRELITYAFNETGLNRIEIKCGTENRKSRAIPERLNFFLEGIVRQGELHNDHFIDLYSYSILKEEWR